MKGKKECDINFLKKGTIFISFKERETNLYPKKIRGRAGQMTLGDNNDTIEQNIVPQGSKSPVTHSYQEKAR